MKLEKTIRVQGTLSHAVVRIVNEAARDQEGNGDASGSRTHQKCWRPAERNQFGTKRATCDSVEQHSSVQDPGAHVQLKQKRTHEINKHVPNGLYKHPVENKCDFGAKDFSKSKAELVDVKDTLQT